MTREERYLRHGDTFPGPRRLQTAVVELGGYDSPDASTFTIAGLAAAGIPVTLSSYPGRHQPEGHWLRHSHDRLAKKVNEEVVFEHLEPDPQLLVKQVRRVADRYTRSWAVVHANCPGAAAEELQPMVHARLEMPVLIAVTAQAGLIVRREPDPEAALRRLGEIKGRDLIPAPLHAELPVAVAGLLINEVMLGGVSGRDDLREPRTVAYYSLAPSRPWRVKVEPHETFAVLVDEISQPLDGAAGARFSNRRLKGVGAGALANWAYLPIAFDGRVSLEIHDEDEVIEEHNLARQILLVDHAGRHAKAPILASELAAIDPPGHYSARVRYVEQPEDIEPLNVDLLLCLPDNDYTRAVMAKAAWAQDEGKGVLYAEAGTGSTGGQFVIQAPGKACLECLTGLMLDSLSSPERGQAAHSCRQAPDSVISSNMAAAGLLVSELRQCLAGHRSHNLRFEGVGGGGNRLGWQINNASCPHRALSRIASPKAVT